MRNTIFVIAIFSLMMASCSYEQFSSSDGDSTSLSSSISNLEKNHLIDDYLITDYENAEILRSHSSIRFSETNEPLIFSNYEEVVSLANSLNEKANAQSGGYNNYNFEISFLNSVNEEAFNEYNLVITNAFTLYSGSNYYRFDNLYLKDSVLYIHLLFHDYHDFGVSGTADMVWECATFMIKKTVSYDDLICLVDKMLPNS